MRRAQKFYRIQELDRSYEEAQLRLQEIEALLNNNVILQEAQTVFSEAEKKYKEQQKNLHQIENQVRDQRYKIEQTEATLYSGRIQNPKELQDLQNESVALKRYLSVLEDRQLEAMIALEEIQQFHDQAIAALEKVRSEIIEQHAELRGKKTALQQDISRLEIEREATQNILTTEERELYIQLRRTRRGIAIARIVDKTCAACGEMLTPATIQAAYSPTQLIHCPGCGRILYSG